ncbi:YlcI/YnfO family protein, partial [Agrobacterium cavarae]
MKSATLPPLRVEPEFREKAQSVLREGETLSSFIEEAVRKQVEIRKSQAEFIARGLA